MVDKKDKQIEELQKQVRDIHKKSEETSGYLEKQIEETNKLIVDTLVSLFWRIEKLEQSGAGQKEQNESQPTKTGEILVELGYVTEAQLEEYLEKQKDLGEHRQRKKLLHIMVESGVITGDQMRTCLTLQEIRSSPKYKY